MTSPVVDESILKSFLADKPGLDSIDRLQIASFMAIIDAFDRKVTRDSFVVIASTAMTLGQVMAKLAILKSTEGFFKSETLDAKMFTDAEKGLMEMALAQHKVLEHKVALLVQCPYDKDPVH